MLKAIHSRKLTQLGFASLVAAACLPAAFAETAAGPEATPAGAEKKTETFGNKLDDTTVRAPRVTDTPETSYTVKEDRTATKTLTPLLDTAQSVSVVTHSLIKDQGSRKLEDALRNVAGVQTGGYYSQWDYFRIRGFDASFDGVFLDGLFGDASNAEETVGLESVEVLKGASSSLYGSGPAGGMVNLRSKRPKAENFADVELTYGSYDYYESLVDAGGVLNKNKTLYGRVVALVRDEGSYIDNVDNRRIYVAPSLTWKPQDDTTFTILSAFRDDDGHMAFPLPAQGTVQPNINGELPISRNVSNNPDANHLQVRNMRLGYELEHKFTDDWIFRQNFRVSYEEQHWDDLLYPSALAPDERTLALQRYAGDQFKTAFRVDSHVEGKFDTAGIKHDLLTGIDYRHDRSDSAWKYDSTAYSATPASVIDIFNPGYAPLAPFDSGYDSDSRSATYGVYVQDRIHLLKPLILTLGGRFDFSESGSDDANAFSPRAGLAYKVTKEITLFTNYAQSFTPQWGALDASGKSVKPSTGENIEVGAKADLFDGGYTTAFAVYQVTRQNIATADLSNPGAFIVSGEQRSRGIEWENTIRPVKGLEILFAYAYTDTAITADNSLPVGARLTGVPLHTLNLWGKYTLQDGTFKGLGFGLGAKHYSKQDGDSSYGQYGSTPFTIPDYTTVDAAIYYDRGSFHAQVNFTNLLDRRYFVGAYDDLYVLPGAPFMIRATVGWTW